MWIGLGLKKGVITTKYPSGVSPEEIPTCVPEKTPSSCPFCAISDGNIRYEKCLFCQRCDSVFTGKLGLSETSNPIGFKKSVHVFFLDTGTCHSCNREIDLLHSPNYDIPRLGFSFTPTPKHADIMLVAGVLTEKMISVVKEAYELMPEPKRVVALGTCATGGISGNGKEDGKSSNISEYVPIDGVIYGCPPSPVQIMEGLLKIAGLEKTIKAEVKIQ